MPWYQNYVFKSDLLQEKPLRCHKGKTGSVNVTFTSGPLNKLVNCDVGSTQQGSKIDPVCFLLLKKKSVKPLLGPLAVKAAIKGPIEAFKLGGGPLALSALGGGGNFDQENIRLTLLRFRNGLPTVGNPLDMS